MACLSGCFRCSARVNISRRAYSIEVMHLVGNQASLRDFRFVAPSAVSFTRSSGKLAPIYIPSDRLISTRSNQAVGSAWDPECTHFLSTYPRVCAPGQCREHSCAERALFGLCCPRSVSFIHYNPIPRRTIGRPQTRNGIMYRMRGRKQLCLTLANDRQEHPNDRPPSCPCWLSRN